MCQTRTEFIEWFHIRVCSRRGRYLCLHRYFFVDRVTRELTARVHGKVLELEVANCGIGD